MIASESDCVDSGQPSYVNSEVKSERIFAGQNYIYRNKRKLSHVPQKHLRCVFSAKLMVV